LPPLFRTFLAFRTDSLIQSAIRDSFSECTVITIAHRLQTIIDSDKIMCMDKGRLVDYAAPFELLSDRRSILYDLVHNLEATESGKLVQLAHEAYLRAGGSPLQQVPEEFFEVTLSEADEEEVCVLFSAEEKEAFLNTRKC